MGARHDHELWRVVNEQTGKPVGGWAFFSQQQADEAIEAWKARAARGERVPVARAALDRLTAIRQRDIKKEGNSNGTTA